MYPFDYLKYRVCQELYGKNKVYKKSFDKVNIKLIKII